MQGQIGDLNSLVSSEKSNLVAAINALVNYLIAQIKSVTDSFLMVDNPSKIAVTDFETLRSGVASGYRTLVVYNQTYALHTYNDESINFVIFNGDGNWLNIWTRSYTKEKMHENEWEISLARNEVHDTDYEWGSTDTDFGFLIR